MDREARTRLREHVGANIRELRQKKGVSLEQLGQPLALCRGSVSLIERGLQAITVDQLVLVAAALDVELGELLREAGKGPGRASLVNPDLLATLIKLGPARQQSLLRLLAMGVVVPPAEPCPEPRRNGTDDKP